MFADDICVFCPSVCGWKVCWMCVRLMQNHMELFSTAEKLFVRRLRLRQQEERSFCCWHWMLKE